MMDDAGPCRLQRLGLIMKRCRSSLKSALDAMLVAFSLGKPGATLPENVREDSQRDAPGLRRRHEPVGLRLAAFALAVAPLCIPAMWNGFPVVYDDVAGYLERWPTHSLGPGRSVPYGLLLWVTASSWWIPVIVLQATALVFVIDRALNVFGLRRSVWTVPAVLILIAVTSGAAFFASQVIPDAWAAPGVLALHLLACHGDALSRRERAAMAAIVVFAGASHMATLGVLAGLSVIYALAWLVRRPLRITVPGIAGAMLATCSGIALLLAADFFVSGRPTLTPGGDAFLFARLIESGIVGKVLAEECPRDDWNLCAFRSNLPTRADDVLWGDNSPLERIGGWDDSRAKREMASIIRRSIVTHPIDHVAAAVALTVRQLFTLATAHNLDPVLSWPLRRTLQHHAPWLVTPFDNSRQQRGTADLAAWSHWIVTPVSIVGTVCLPLIAIVLWRQRRRAAMLPAMMFVALIGNAFICGVVSGPSDRYQARLAWLAPWSATVAVLGAALSGAEAVGYHHGWKRSVP